METRIRKPLGYNFVWLFISFGIGTGLFIMMVPTSLIGASIVFVVVGLGIQYIQPDFFLNGVDS